ncbi:MAG: oligosaccharide flippase family protein [candidate division WOR-3 bacterium]|nr:MAG: oligosaccharide flippase family protein [candidate division WOR-3 bacterium]
MIAQKLILSYGSKVTIQIMQVAASILVARIAGPTVLGTLAFGLSFVSMFSFVNTFWGPAHIKTVSEGRDLGTCVSTFSVLKYSTTALFIGIVIAVFTAQKFVFKTDFESDAHQYVIFILLAAIVIEQLLSIPKSTFAARTEQAKQDIPELIKVFIWQILRIVVVLLGFRAIALATTNLIAVLIIAPIIILLFRSYPRGRFDRSLAATYLKISVPFLFMDLCHNAVNYLDKIMLQYFANSQQVGYYTAGYRIGGFFLIMASSVGMLFFPLFSKAVSEGNFNYLRDKVLQFERFSFLFIMPLVVFLVIYSDMIVGILLGSQYIPSIAILSIITAATFIRVISDPYGNVLTGMGFFNLLLRLNLVNLFFFIVAMVIFLDSRFLNLGAQGVAYAILLSNILMGAMYRVFAKSKCKVIDLRKNFRFILFGMANYAIFGVVYLYGKAVFGLRFQIIFPIIFFAISYSFFVIFRWINTDDWRMLLSVARVDKVLEYIKSEFRIKG